MAAADRWESRWHRLHVHVHHFRLQMDFGAGGRLSARTDLQVGGALCDLNLDLIAAGSYGLRVTSGHAKPKGQQKYDPSSHAFPPKIWMRACGK